MLIYRDVPGILPHNELHGKLESCPILLPRFSLILLSVLEVSGLWYKIQNVPSLIFTYKCHLV